MSHLAFVKPMMRWSDRKIGLHLRMRGGPPRSRESHRHLHTSPRRQCAAASELSIEKLQIAISRRKAFRVNPTNAWKQERPASSTWL